MTDELEVWLDDPLVGAEPRAVGELLRSTARGREVTRFRYASAWLEECPTAFALDPELPLAAGEFFPRVGRALHGVFRDSAPDRWGRVLMERREAGEARRVGRRPRTLGEWEFLTGVNDAGRLGALRLREPGSGRWLDDRAPGIPPAARQNPCPERSEHALALDESDGRPELATLRSTARFYRLREREAARIEAEVRAALAPWRRLAKRLGLARDEVELLAAVLSSAGE